MDLNNEYLSIIINLKFNQLKRNGLKNLNLKQFLDYLLVYKVKNFQGDFSELVVEIMNVDGANVVSFLAKEAIVTSKNQSIDSFGDLFRKN